MAGARVTPGRLLHRLRGLGYSLVRCDSGLSVSGPLPRDPDAAAEMLAEHKLRILEILKVEEHPAVEDALRKLPGAWVKEVRRPKGGTNG